MAEALRCGENNGSCLVNFTYTVNDARYKVFARGLGRTGFGC